MYFGDDILHTDTRCPTVVTRSLTTGWLGVLERRQRAGSVNSQKQGGLADAPADQSEGNRISEPMSDFSQQKLHVNFPMGNPFALLTLLP